MYTRPIRILAPNSLRRNGAELRLYGAEYFLHQGYRTGEKVDNWRKKIIDGVNATSPYVLDRIFVKKADPASCVGTHYLKYRSGYEIYRASYAFEGYFGDISQFGQAFFGHILGISADAEAAALSRLYGKIREDMYAVNGLLVLGELRETIQMLRNPLAAADKALQLYLNTLKANRKEISQKVLRRRREKANEHSVRRANALLNAMSGSWLELQFGLLPAVSDAKDILGEALGITRNSGDYRRRLRARSPSSTLALDEVGVGNPLIDPGLLWKRSYHRTTETSVQYLCGLRKTIAAPVQTMESTLSRFGFQIQNFVPTIYELIPWSFLVDYFVNLGDIVEAVCTDTSNVTWITRSVRQDTSVRYYDTAYGYSENGDPYWAGEIKGNGSSAREFRHLTVTRTKPESLPIPPLVVSVPGTDSKKWLNMAALLEQTRRFRF